jgi:hypothetical protein
MPTSRVELVGTLFGSSGSNGGSGNTIAKVIDGNPASFYDAFNLSGDYYAWRSVNRAGLGL